MVETFLFRSLFYFRISFTFLNFILKFNFHSWLSTVILLGKFIAVFRGLVFVFICMGICNYASVEMCTNNSKINGIPKGAYLPISKLHSILALKNLLTHK